MRHIFIIIALVLSLFITACFKNETEPFKVGIIQYRDTNDQTRSGFIDGLSALGYESGKNITYLYFGNAKNFDEIKQQITNIIEQNPDLIYASPTPAARIAYEMTKEDKIPVLFAPVNDPIKTGLVKNLAKPGEHITGIRLAPSDEKRLEWIKTLDPTVKHVLVPYTLKDKSAQITISNITAAAAEIGLVLDIRPVKSKADIVAITENLPEKMDAIFMPRDGLVMSSVELLSKAAKSKKAHLSTPRYEQIELGATMGYGFVGYELGVQASRMADIILRGTNPGDIPVETTEDYLFIDENYARKLGLEIDRRILSQIYR